MCHLVYNRYTKKTSCFNIINQVENVPFFFHIYFKIFFQSEWKIKQIQQQQLFQNVSFITIQKVMFVDL